MADRKQNLNLDSLFLAALEIESPQQRAAFLAQSCGGNASLQREVEQLLRSHEQARGLLDQPAPELEAAPLPSPAGQEHAAALEAGLAAVFPANAAAVIGNAKHSVLKAMERTIDVPRVVLREEAQSRDPIVRPKSPEMPDRNTDSRYQLQGEIARGGMGAILKGRDTDLGRDLAIKVLLEEHKHKPDVIQRFVEEAQIGGQLQHPGIAPVYELGQFADRRPFFSMKLVKGETLSKLLAERKESAEDRGRFLGIFEQICQTMAYAHSRGVIHRDLKPANVMVGAFGEVQVMDWGLAKVLPAGGVADEKAHKKQQGQSIIQTLRSAGGSDAPGTFGTYGSQTQMGSVMGTPAYMAPEQALGEIDNLDERADVFGLGAILCEILTGNPPYVGTDSTAVFRQASRGKLADCMARLDACGADDDLVQVAKDCLELEPKDRPRNAGVLAERVTAYLESVETRLRESELERAAEAARADAEAAQAAAERQRAQAESARAEAESARAQEERKRRRTSLALAASVLLLVGMGGGGWLYMAHLKANRQTAEAEEQRKHAAEMEQLAQQRDTQRLAAEKAEAKALEAKSAAERDRAVALTAQTAAEAAQERGRRLLYATDMQLAPMLWKDNDATLAQLRSRLDAHNPDRNPDLQGKQDLRGFEWYYYQHLVESGDAVFSGHDGSVADARLTSDGHLITLTDRGQVRRWDLISREEREASRRSLDGGESSQSQVLSTSGRLAALAAGKKVFVFDATSGKEIWRVDSSPRYRRLIFSPAGDRLVIVDDRIRWLDAASGQVLATVDQKFDRGTANLALSADGLTLAVAGHGQFGGQFSVLQLDAKSGKAVTLSENIKIGPTIAVVALNADGRRIAAGSKLSGSLYIFDIAKGRLLARHDSAHPSPISALNFSADGTRLATADTQGTIKIWRDVDQLSAENDPLITLKGHAASIARLGFSSDGAQLVSAGADATARVWDVSNPGVTIQALTQSGSFPMAGFSRDGSLIAVAGEPSVRLWDAATGQLVRQLPAVEQGNATSVAFSPTDSRLLAVGYGEATGVSHVSLWDIESGIELARLPGTTDLPDFPTDEHAHSVGALAFSPDGKYLVAGFGSFHIYSTRSQANPLKVLDVSARRLIRRLNGHTGYCSSLQFSADGTLLASGNRDGRVIVWSTATWKPMQTLINPDPHTTYGQEGRGMVGGVAFSPDGTTLAMASLERHVHLWDVRTGGHVATLAGHSDAVHSVAFSPDGRTLASGGNDQTVRLWNTATGRELMQLDSGSIQLGGVWSLTFSPDGRQLLAGGDRAAFWSAAPNTWRAPHRMGGQLARLLASQADFRNSIRMFSENLRLHEALAGLDANDPRVAAALAATRANWHASQRRWSDAATEFERLEQLSPNAPQSWLQAPGLLRVSQALFEQNESLGASKLLAAAARQLEMDGSGRENLLGIHFAQDFPGRLVEVLANSPASRAGLRAGDVILKVNGVELTEQNESQSAQLFAVEPGTTLTLTVQRDGHDEPEQIELTKELVFVDAPLREHVDELQANVERRLAEHPDDWSALEFRAELHALAARHQAQAADYTSAIEVLSRRPTEETAADLARLYRRRGDAHLVLQQWQLALDDYARVVSDEVTDEVLPTNEASALANVLLEGVEAPESNATDPWVRLAAAFRLKKNPQAIDDLVARRPQAAGNIGGLYADDQDWQRAVEIYTQGINADANDFDLIARRARAYEELENWEAAAADWSRATTEGPEGAARLAEFATRLAYAGQRELATKERQRARQLLEAAFQADEGNDLVAEQLAQVLLDMSEPEWTVLEPMAMESAGGATLTKLDDGSIFASGPNPDQDTYRVTAVVPKSNLAAVRLEIIPDPRLPGGGGGRALDSGNFVLSQFSLKSLSQDDVVQVPLEIVDAFATYEENSWTIARAFDQAADTAWATFPKQTMRQSAVFVLAKAAAAGDRLSIEVECRHPRVSEEKGCNIGRFRLSVLTDPAQIPIERRRLAAAQLTDLWTKLAAARATSGQVKEAIRQFDKILAGTVGLEARNAVIHQLQRFDEVLPALAQRHPEEPQLQLALARQLKLHGERALAAEEPAAAVAQLKQAQEIFNRLLREPQWRVLTPTEITSESGSTLAVQPDGSILASGTTPEQETYAVAARPGLPSITALRLETLPHPSLPKGGSGRDPNGSFFLNELKVTVSQPGDLPGPDAPPWKLQSAVDSFHRTTDDGRQHPIQNAIDGDAKTNWDAWPEVYQRQEAVFEMTPNPADLTAATLMIRLRSGRGGALGRFRLAVTHEPEVVKRVAARSDLKPNEVVDLIVSLAKAHGQSGQLAEASASFAQALHLVTDRASKSRIVAEAAPLAGVLEKLAERAEDDALFQAALARHFAKRGDRKLAARSHTKARTLLERQLAAAPADAALAGELAELLVAGRGPEWTVLKPSEVRSEGGTELSPQGDGSILASEEPVKNETYVITAPLKPGKVTALYLEALPHASLPRLGPGWGDSNFHLTQFRAWLQKSGQDAVPLQFRLAAASHIRTVAERAGPQDGPWAAIDGTQETVWDIWPKPGKPHWLVLSLPDSIDAAEGDQLIVHLDFQDQRFPRAKLGRFRLSIGDDESLIEEFLLSDAIRSAEIRGFDALAAAHLATGDPSRAAELLRPTPDTDDSQVRLLLRLMAQRALGESAAARQTGDALFQSLKTEHPPRSLLEFCFEIAREVGSVDRLQFNRLLAETGVIQPELARLTREVEAKPAEPAGFNSRAQYFARLGRWRQCANDYLQVVKLDPPTHRPWGIAASALLMAGDKEGYRQHCQAMLKQHHGTNNASVADVVCKNGLLLPDAVPVSELPTQLVRQGMDDPKWNNYRTWFTACNALISYREGQPADAIDWTKKMPSLASSSGALALVVRAMSEKKLEQHEQAVKSLAEAEALIPVELRTLGAADFAGALPVPAASIYHDWLIAEILRREAEALIKSNRDPEPDSGPPRQ